MNKNKNKYIIISGSTRNNSQSKKVATFVSSLISKSLSNPSTNVIDLAIDKFPLWAEEFWNNGPNWDPAWMGISNSLKQADGVIMIVPEWNGMVPPQLNNLLHLCTNNELAHKPALIISISSGQGGSYPIAELRMSSFKNTKICYIPEQVIIREVKDKLNDPELIQESERYIVDRLEHSLKILEAYAISFREIRQHSLIIESKFPYGM